MRSILVLAAHPDDEVLGCGGTLAKLADEGATIHVAFLADGVFSREGDAGVQQAELTARRAAAQKACDILGVKSVFFGEFPDNRMDTIALLDIIKPIEALIARYHPDTVFTHHAGDVNVDHRRTHEAIVTACRPQCGHPVKTVLCFEVPSSTEWQLPGSAPVFSPNWFVDISNTLDRKLAALNAYAAELHAWPHPRSLQGVLHLAHWRGATVGVDAAEAFILGRQLA
ncbi:N-acetylglucosaminyl-phosphatidylinositol de-N-acetylase family protein [Sulfuricella denitrificans skB26]|uniref:N-acetylglucosaminyl-phosphatidylinositol de-N-acetylase family protein n=1 Tax=Sulfuricella denitrificans (strain DSM 22764 / NBRC 105220 / skB26) TaxID=1163617 RepID=S6B8N2_SULDS|nr:PIG-L deacetylase family protein [Sulfuricella denitrificans]BAN36702.1 N-acetylglucosaminyl-phosphatidylinositol de-N-acetylase family protein [Sulfuricella denitrificans skB26]